MRPRREPPTSGETCAQLAAAPSFFKSMPVNARGLTIAAAAVSMLAALAAADAKAQALSVDAGAWTFSLEGEADIALAAAAERAGQPRHVFFDAGARIEAERFLENGWRIGFESGYRGRRDDGRRGVGLSGQAGGAFSGRAFDPDDPSGARGDLETAALFLRTGWGELRAGRDEGAAAREAAQPLLPLRLHRLDLLRLDPSGRNLVRTRNTLTGRAAKLTVSSRRFFGVRASASWTPEPDDCGLDACPPRSLDLENGVELGASFDHVFRGSGLAVLASVEAASAQRGPDAAVTPGLEGEDPWALSGRFAVSRGGWSAGVSALETNDGFASGGYAAIAGFLAYERGDWLAALEAGDAASDLSGEDGRRVQASASRLIGDHWVAGGGLAWSRRSASGFESEGVSGFISGGLRF